ncbi:NrsF family protein [Craterilacuibacter sp.]|uniref:NrsF family protein n=1 Tax=Craterilacuibacter sp. TaxID=2870909 RepID=UPI003F3D87C1
MKTAELIDLLAAGETRLAPQKVARPLARALLAGLLAALLLMLVLLRLNPALAADAGRAIFWVKPLFALSLLLPSLLLAVRLSRPGTRVAGLAPALLLPVLLLWLPAGSELAAAPEAARWALLAGSSWQACVPSILLLSLPVWGLMLMVMRRLAPTRLRLAGAAAGLVAGSGGALVYTLHCPELALPFVALWYLAGMLLPALLGAITGPRLLAW